MGWSSSGGRKEERRLLVAARAAAEAEEEEEGDGEGPGGFLAADAAGDAGSGWDTGLLPSPVKWKYQGKVSAEALHTNVIKKL